MDLLLLLACGEPEVATPTEHSGFPSYVDVYDTGPPSIERVTVACDAEDTVTVDALLGGWASGGVVYAIETADPAPWAEEHDLESYEYDPFGAYDKLAVELSTGVARADRLRDVSSAFTCDGHFERPDRMTYAVATWDLFGELADCLVWGHDPSAVRGGATSPDPEADLPSFDLSRCALAETPP